MTGIPDEVVNRCAEVLVNCIRGNHGLGPVPLSDVGDPDVYRHHVRVVLAGCYWLEMREALAWYVDNDETDTDTGFYAEGREQAKAVLAATRGETP